MPFDRARLLRCSLLLALLAGATVGCVSDTEEEADESEDPLTARGTGVGSTLTIPGSCKTRRVGHAEFDPETPDSVKLKIMQGAGQVFARFPTRDFNDVDVQLAASGTGSKDATRFGHPFPRAQGSSSPLLYPKHTIAIDVRLADGSIEVAIVRTAEDQVGSATTECSYEAPTTLWLDPNDSPPAPPALRFPEGKLKSNGWCMAMPQGRLRVVPCTQAPRWAIAKDHQLLSDGKCVKLGDIASGAQFPYLGDCPGQRVPFVISKISTGRRCLPTHQDPITVVNPVRGSHVVDCTNVAGGLGDWSFRENGALYSSNDSRQCLMRNEKRAWVGSCSGTTRWEPLPQGRIRNVGTNDCVYANASGALTMGDCNEALPPWRFKGTLTTRVKNSDAARYLTRTPSGVVDLASSFASSEWEFNF